MRMRQQNRENVSKVFIHSFDCLLEIFVLLDIELFDRLLDLDLVVEKSLSLHQDFLVLLLRLFKHQLDVRIDSLLQLYDLGFEMDDLLFCFLRIEVLVFTF
jgi:hypothetical protein